MTTTQTSDLSYDPYDVEIDRDPYPTFARLRDEAPLYYNEQYDFYALSRYDDVEHDCDHGFGEIAQTACGGARILLLFQAGQAEAERGAVFFFLHNLDFDFGIALRQCSETSR